MINWLRRLLPVAAYRVRGESMLPVLKPGNVFLASHWYKPLKPGMIVVIRSGRRLTVKRIVDIADHGLWVEGDNKTQSTDSRQFGHIAPKSVQGVMFVRLL